MSCLVHFIVYNVSYRYIHVWKHQKTNFNFVMVSNLSNCFIVSLSVGLTLNKEFKKKQQHWFYKPNKWVPAHVYVVEQRKKLVHQQSRL